MLVSEVKDKIVVQSGRVIQVEHWVAWNGEPYPAIVVTRKGDQFISHIGDPEHGGGQNHGSLLAVTEGFHPNIQRQYQTLFGLNEITPETISIAGFPRYAIEEV